MFTPPQPDRYTMVHFERLKRLLNLRKPSRPAVTVRERSSALSQPTPRHYAVVVLWLISVWLFTALTGGTSAQEPAPPPESLDPPPPPPATQPASPTAQPIPFLTPTPIGALSATSTLPTGQNIAVIKVEGLIYGYTFESLKQRVTQATQNGASLIVIELDTPGGLVDSALKISKYIKSLNTPTIAWINAEAYSAGIMIAAACDEIVMAPSAATGDCAPIVPGMNLSPTERAKALSPILEEFRDSASKNGYDYAMFHAMCVLGVQVFQIENPKTGQRRLVNQADYAVMVDGEPLNMIASPNPTPTPRPTSTPPATQPNPNTPPTLNPTPPTLEIGAATITVATQADRGQWQLVQKIHDGTTLLTLNQQRALDTGLASQIIQTDTQLEQYLGAASTTRIHPSRVALAAYWLTQPWVRAILMIAMLIGAYLEFQAPGLGLPGGIATISLLLLLIAPFLVGLAQVWHVVLFLIGLLLLLAEVFVIPGFGVAGISGIVCMFIGLVLMVVPSSGQGPMPMPAPEVAQRLRDSVMFTLVGIVASFVGLYYLVKHFGSLPLFNRLILKTPPPAHATAGSPTTASAAGEQDALGQPTLAPGRVGQTQTHLRPSGRAIFGDQIIDVITQGEWIEPNQRIIVTEAHGNVVVVEAQNKP